MSKHLPPSDFLLTVLAQVAPNHRYFDKSFVCEPKRRKKKQEELRLEGHEGFFEGLPPPFGKFAKKRANASTFNRIAKLSRRELNE